LFDKKILEIEDKMDDIGKKSFVLGTAIALGFADDITQGRIYRKGYFDRAVIGTEEKEIYKELPKSQIKYAVDPLMDIKKQLPDTEKVRKYMPKLKERIKISKDYIQKSGKLLTDFTYTIPEDQSGRVLGTRISQAIDIGNKLGAIIDLRKQIKERENVNNDFRQNYEKWFDVNFRQYYKDLPNPIRASEIFTIEKFRKAYNDLVNKGVLAENELQKLKKSMLDTGYPDYWYQVSLTRAEHFN